MKSIVFLFLFFGLAATAQTLTKVDSIPLDAEVFVGKDSYQNIYFIKDMVLHKTGPLGEFVFRDYQLGPPASVDIINPLNVVLYYEEANTVVMVDNRLNELERINFNTINDFVNVGAARNAGNNRLWIFNIDNQQLELYNYRSGLRLPISQPISEEVIGLANDFNYCYVLTTNAIQKYNVYGSFLSESGAENFEQIVQQNEWLFALKEGVVYLEAKLDEDTVILLSPINPAIPENPILNLQLTQDFLYIYDGNFVHSYTLTKPKQ